MMKLVGNTLPMPELVVQDLPARKRLILLTGLTSKAIVSWPMKDAVSIFPVMKLM